MPFAFSRITDKGRKQLKEQRRDWERRAAAIARLLEA
jgi:DNA-binding PadR family transcriptional regulator